MQLLMAPHSFRYFLQFSSMLLISLALADTVVAWQAKGKPKPEDDELEEPVDEKIEVKDGLSKLNMAVTYYPSSLGKEAVPVLLLHGYEGTRADYDYLAEVLQSQGHAVIVPDLRGHGDSAVLHLADGRDLELDPKKMKKADFAALVKDLEAVKTYILKKNNKEELNMEMLTIVGADMTTVTAMNFALRDWTAPELLSFKNCKDVKAAVLLSPEQSYQGADMRLALKHAWVGHKMSVLIAVGEKDNRAKSEAKKLYNLLQKQHGEANDEKRDSEREVVYHGADTNLQGTKLVARNLDVVPFIAAFIRIRVKAFAEDWSYSERIKP